MKAGVSLVIIPTYNEIENIASIIKAVFELEEGYEILIVDDGSPDGTATKVQELQEVYPNTLHLLQRKGKLGLGTAYIAGFKYALKNGYDYIFEMDADFSHNPKDLPRLKAAIENSDGDLAVGSRYTRGGGVKNWPIDRILLSYGASWYVRLITWMWVKDPTAGFVCYSNKVLASLDFDKVKFIGYAFQIEMKYYARQKKFKIVEVPITFVDREKGASKMAGSIVSEAIKGVLSMKWKGLRGYYK